MNAEKPDRLDIIICMGSSCFARGNGDNLGVIEDYLEENGMEARVELAGSRCEGLCADGPMLSINDRRFHKVDREMLLDILREVCPAEEARDE